MKALFTYSLGVTFVTPENLGQEKKEEITSFLQSELMKAYPETSGAMGFEMHPPSISGE